MVGATSMELLGQYQGILALWLAFLIVGHFGLVMSLIGIFLVFLGESDPIKDRDEEYQDDA